MGEELAILRLGVQRKVSVPARLSKAIGIEIGDFLKFEREDGGKVVVTGLTLKEIG